MMRAQMLMTNKHVQPSPDSLMGDWAQPKFHFESTLHCVAKTPPSRLSAVTVAAVGKTTKPPSVTQSCAHSARTTHTHSDSHTQSDYKHSSP